MSEKLNDLIEKNLPNGCPEIDSLGKTICLINMNPVRKTLADGKPGVRFTCASRSDYQVCLACTIHGSGYIDVAGSALNIEQEVDNL